MNQQTVSLLLRGAEITGTYTEGFEMMYEYFGLSEVEDLHNFCEWVDREIGGAGSDNIHKLFEAFTNPNDPELGEYAKEIAEQISRIKALTSQYSTRENYMIFDEDGIFKGVEKISEAEAVWYKENNATLVTGVEAKHAHELRELAELCITNPKAGSSRLWVEAIQLKASQILSSIKKGEV